MIRVYVNDLEYKLLEFSLSINETLNERSTCSFSIKTNININLQKGMRTRVESTGDTLFNGFINSATHKDYPVQGVRVYVIECVDLHYLIDKRVYVRGFVDQMCGDIVKTMVNEVLADEGITYTEDSIEVGFNLPAISFSYRKCSDILDQLAEISNYVWYVDYNGVLHFKGHNATGVAPEVTDSIIRGEGLVITNKNNQYRNRQYIKGAVAETNEITQIFYGDGANKSFTLGYRLAEKPKIWIGGEYIYEDDIVLKGYNETAKWYYQKQDAVILQNLDAEPVAKGVEIRVVYKGIFPIVAITESMHEIERNKSLGSGTGVVEVVDDESDITNLGTAISTAIGRLGKYCGDTYQVDFTTSTKGFDVGQTVTFNTTQLKDDNYLIESIEIIDDLNIVWYKITAVKGALVDSWEKTLGRGLRSKPTVANTEIEEQETVVLNRSFSKVWTKDENPNIMRILYPDGSVTAGAGLTPTFIYDQRVSYIEILDAKGTVLTRNIRSSQSDPSRDTIYTYFYIDPFIAIGEWAKVRFYGGYQASFTIGSGVLIDEQPITLTKSNLEGVQIARTDTKGW